MKPKKVFITIDMEGISCIVDPDQVRADRKEYEVARKLMVGDLNATVEGVLEAGAKDIVVSEIHGRMQNLIPEMVHEAAYLIQGYSKPDAILEGISGEFDVALFVGYHSMNGTERGVLCHPFAGVMDQILINNQEIGEFGICAALAGRHGVPSIFVSGDSALAAEAERLIPNITTAVVKWGIHKFAAKCLQPERSRALIKNKATEAMSKVATVNPYSVEEPVNVQIQFVEDQMAEAVAILPHVEKVCKKTVEAVFEDYFEAVQGFRAFFTLAGATRNR